MPAQRITVARTDLRDVRVEAEPTVPLADGELRLQVDLFALTANNITYAAFGEAMRYWAFFPCGDPSRGCIPVWGFAEVSESRVDGLPVGERLYGYLPMAQSLTLSPVRVDETGFVDGAAHRRDLPAVYNHYLRCRNDPGWQHAHEAQIALLRPLFSTAFLIDDFLAEAACFGAGTVLLSSASSKTAWATAFCLARRRGTGAACRVIGLTSPGNLAYCRGLGVYDAVHDYADLPAVQPDGGLVYVDFSGSTALRGSVHRQFGERLAHSCAVGGTHWEDLGGSQGLPGPKPTLFFAPSQVKKRLVDWGSAELATRIAEAWRAFMGPVNDPVSPWMRVVRGQGPEAVRAAYLAQLDGRVPAIEGQVLSL